MQHFLATNIPYPDLLEAFMKIDSKEQWFPQIPEEYLVQLKCTNGGFINEQGIGSGAVSNNLQPGGG